MNPLFDEATKRRERDKAYRKEKLRLKTYDCMSKCSPQLEQPVWFDPYVRALDSCLDEQNRPREVKLCFSGPPQHGKTEISKHALVSWATRAPGLCHAYATYNFDRAREVAEKVRILAQIAGLNPRLREGTLWLDGGTEIRFVGPGGSLTGNPISGTLLVDDLTKGRADAESKVIRESNWGWFTDDAQTRIHPGSSRVVMATRWHIDDLIGRLIKKEWPYLRIPAECDSEDDAIGRSLGEALWPAGRPSEWLQQFKDNPYTWASMYQGRPRPRGDALFGEPSYYDELPRMPFTRGHGADLAYSEKTRSDWSVMVSGRRYVDDIYLTDELRKQCQSPEFTAMMKRCAPAGRILWLCSGTEKGVAQHIKHKIPGFAIRIATTDKYQRATPCAEDGWNVGRILLPAQAEWTNEFVDEICGFTGVKDLCDDRVDALAALWMLLGRGSLSAESSALNRDLRKTSEAKKIRNAFRFS